MAERITFAPEFKAQVQEWMKANPQKTRVATIEAASAHFKGKAKTKDGKKCNDPSLPTLGLWYNAAIGTKPRRGKAKTKASGPKQPRGRKAAATPVSSAISKTGTRLIEQARDLEKRIHGEIVDGLKSLDALHTQLSEKMAEYEKIFNRKAEDVLAKNKDIRETLSRVGLSTGLRGGRSKKA
ncbi:MAG: hypothetical protein RLZZ303_2684 [Candidatus Hydrogenedentota bacterium]|jgi:hypothetical protein